MSRSRSSSTASLRLSTGRSGLKIGVVGPQHQPVRAQDAAGRLDRARAERGCIVDHHPHPVGIEIDLPRPRDCDNALADERQRPAQVDELHGDAGWSSSSVPASRVRPIWRSRPAGSGRTRAAPCCRHRGRAVPRPHEAGVDHQQGAHGVGGGETAGEASRGLRRQEIVSRQDRPGEAERKSGPAQFRGRLRNVGQRKPGEAGEPTSGGAAKVAEVVVVKSPIAPPTSATGITSTPSAPGRS